MPNGKPGDNPYTDIVSHGANIFGGGIDELVRELACEAGPSSIEAIAELLWEFDPTGGAKPNLDELRKRLESFRSFKRG